MLIGYEATNALRNSEPLGDFCREFISRMANRHISSLRALLFSTRIKDEYRQQYTSYANVSTYVPTGLSTLMPSMWMRFGLGACLQEEKVKLYHGLNEELPYGLGAGVKKVVTCYGLAGHYRTSAMDTLVWRRRMRYAFRVADIVVAVSDDVCRELVASGVPEAKIEVIGTGNPYEVTDEVVERYYALYERLLQG